MLMFLCCFWILCHKQSFLSNFLTKKKVRGMCGCFKYYNFNKNNYNVLNYEDYDVFFIPI